MDASNLSVLPGGNQEEDLRDVKYTQDGLRKFIVQVLDEKGKDANGITVDDVLKKPFLAGLRKTLHESYEKQIKEVNSERAKKRRKLQVAQDRIMAETAEKLNASLRAEYGLSVPLTQEEIQAKLMAPVVNTVETKTKVQASVQANGAEIVRSRVLALRKELVDKLPAIAFESADGAVEVRRVIKYCVQNLRAKRQEQGLDADYLAIVNKLYDRIQNGLFPMIDKVVVEGWGLELGKSLKNNQILNEVVRVMSEDIRFTAMIKWMKGSPKLEELQATVMTEAQLAEAKAKADAEKVAAEVALKKRRAEIRPELRARLLEVAPELSGESAEQLAKHLARKFGHMASIKDMFTAAANECKALAKKNKEEQAAAITINRYIKAAGLTTEEFEAQFATFAYHKERIAVDTDNVGNQRTPAGFVSPLGNRTAGDRKVKETARRARQSARQKADDARRPKPNEGKGLMDQKHSKPSGDVDGNKK